MYSRSGGGVYVRPTALGYGHILRCQVYSFCREGSGAVGVMPAAMLDLFRPAGVGLVGVMHTRATSCIELGAMMGRGHEETRAKKFIEITVFEAAVQRRSAPCM